MEKETVQQKLKEYAFKWNAETSEKAFQEERQKLNKEICFCEFMHKRVDKYDTKKHYTDMLDFYKKCVYIIDKLCV